LRYCFFHSENDDENDDDNEHDNDDEHEHEHENIGSILHLRILIATNMYPVPGAPYYGVFVQLQEQSLRRLGMEVDVDVHLGSESRWNYFKGVPQLARRLRAKDYDVIHTHHTYSTLVALAARRLAGRRVPIVETFHESDIFHRGVDYGQDLVRRLKYSHRLKAWALRRVDFAIPVQRDMLRVVLGDAAERVPSRVLPVGLDLERFTPGDRRAARERLGWDPGQCVIFFPCDPKKPEKRHDLAQGGFDLFARERPGARLVVGGKIPAEQMTDTIRAAAAILLPTDYEASPSAVKEALACERPVVSTDVGDVRECYGDLAGVLICDWTAQDVAAKLRRAVVAPIPFGGRQRLIDLGLGLEESARKLIEVYEEVLARQR